MTWCFRSIMLAFFVFYAFPISAGKIQNLCQKSEIALFECIIGGKLASICIGHSNAKFPQYRFGTYKNIELVYPQSMRGKEGELRLSRAMYSGGGEVHIRFSRNEYEYIMYDSTIRTSFGADARNETDFRSGIVIKRRGKIIVDRQCLRSSDSGIRSPAYQVLPTEKFTPIR